MIRLFAVGLFVGIVLATFRNPGAVGEGIAFAFVASAVALVLALFRGVG